MEEERDDGYFYASSGSNVRPSKRCRHCLLGNGTVVGRSRWKTILYIIDGKVRIATKFQPKLEFRDVLCLNMNHH